MTHWPKGILLASMALACHVHALDEAPTVVMQHRHGEGEGGEEHAGHDAMHAEILLIYIGTAIVVQILLLLWRRYSQGSYQKVTLAGLWAIPAYISLYERYWRFLGIWGAFSLLAGAIFLRASQRHVSPGTPWYGNTCLSAFWA